VYLYRLRFPWRDASLFSSAPLSRLGVVQLLCTLLFFIIHGVITVGDTIANVHHRRLAIANVHHKRLAD
jgi:hypothetical protein